MPREKEMNSPIGGCFAFPFFFFTRSKMKPVGKRHFLGPNREEGGDLDMCIHYQKEGPYQPLPEKAKQDLFSGKRSLGSPLVCMYTAEP